ncbi:Uncharacterised protein [Escherichia coli]|uniref:Uncharacterized protein n=1 Tax=Escherichia coli TaxID=562 RepID=A0A2X1L2T3_ECOLX|nr:Uncharacterised protein [Escherichia coli]
MLVSKKKYDFLLARYEQAPPVLTCWSVSRQS